MPSSMSSCRKARRIFLANFLDSKKKVTKLDLALRADFRGGGPLAAGTRCNRTSASATNVPRVRPKATSSITGADLRGHRTVLIPAEMIEIFRVVKAYEELPSRSPTRDAASLRASGYKPMAEHQTREVFRVPRAALA